MPAFIRALPLLCLPWLLAAPVGAGPVSADWQEVCTRKGELAFIRDLTAFALNRPVAELSAALAQASTLPESRQSVARSVLVSAWTERDVDSAVNASQSAKPAWTQAERIPFFQTLARLSPDRAFALADAEPSPEIRSAAIVIIMQALAERDPRRFVLELHARHLDAEAGTDSFPEMLMLWANIAPADALAAIPSRTDTTDHPDFRMLILNRWARRSPADALEWITRHLQGSERTEAVRQLALSVAQTDWETLRKLAGSTRDADLRTILEKTVREAASWQPPETIWKQIKAEGWKDLSDDALPSLINYAATRPKAEALAFYRGIPPDFVGNSYVSDQLSEAWTLADPDSALAWARGLTDTDLRDHTLLHINSMLTEVDPDFALAQIEQTPQGPLQTQLIRNTALAFAKTDLPRAADWVFSLKPGAAQNAAVEALATGAARNHPVEFTAQLDKLPAGLARTRLFGDFAAKWLQMDTVAASAWLLALPDGPERSAALKPALRALAAQSPEQALDMAAATTRPSERADLIKQLAEFQSVQNTDKVLALIDTLPEGRDKKQALQRALQTLAEDDPASMSELIEEGTFGVPGGNVVSTLLDKWKGPPSEAAAWLARMTAKYPGPSGINPAYTSNFVRDWARSEPAAALAWVTTLPEDKHRAAAADALVRSTAERFPSRGLALAAQLGASDRALRETIESLSLKTPDRVETLIRDSTLPDARKTQALAWIKK
jgi:hypothetical protein